MATNGQEWTSIFAQYNSGTYNNVGFGIGFFFSGGTFCWFEPKFQKYKKNCSNGLFWTILCSCPNKPLSHRALCGFLRWCRIKPRRVTSRIFCHLDLGDHTTCNHTISRRIQIAQSLTPKHCYFFFFCSPYFPEMFNYSGCAAYQAQWGNYFSYDLNPRASEP